jgi:hypothetical protein
MITIEDVMTTTKDRDIEKFHREVTEDQETGAIASIAAVHAIEDIKK